MKEFEMCCGTTCDKEIVKAEFEGLTYIAREISACIDEYKAIREKSLLQAMFNMNDRLKAHIDKPSAEIEALKAENLKLINALNALVDALNIGVQSKLSCAELKEALKIAAGEA